MPECCKSHDQQFSDFIESPWNIIIIKQFKTSIIWGMLGCWPHIHTPPNTSGSRAWWHHKSSNGNAIKLHAIPRIRRVVFQSKAWRIDLFHWHWCLNFVSTNFPEPNSRETNKQFWMKSMNVFHWKCILHWASGPERTALSWSFCIKSKTERRTCHIVSHICFHCLFIQTVSVPTWFIHLNGLNVRKCCSAISTIPWEP